MAKINEGSFHDWNDGETVKARDYKQEREIIRVAVNDTHDRFLDEQANFQQIKTVVEENVPKIEAFETTAAEVETKGNYALAQGDYAKGQGNAIQQALEKSVNLLKSPTKPDGIVEGRLWLDTSDNAYQGTVFNELSTQLAQTETDLDQRGVNIVKYGALGLGTTDDSIALQNAVNENKHVHIPKTMILRLDKVVEIPSDCVISGGGVIRKNTNIKYGLHIKGNNVTITGLVFKPIQIASNPNVDIKVGVGCKNINISNNIFTSVGENRIYSAIASADDPSISDTDFPYVNNVEGLIIEGNIFEGYTRPLYLFCIDNFTITGNLFRDSIFDAIRIREAIGHGIITHNQFINVGDSTANDDQTRDAIDTAFSGYKLIISNNIVKKAGRIGFDIKGVDRIGDGYSTRSIIITDNIVEHTKLAGIEIGETSESAPDYLTNFIISNNQVIECNQVNISGGGSDGDAGILIKANVRYVTISNNHCISNYGRGIFIARSGTADIENIHHVNVVDNICINNTRTGIYLLAPFNAIVSRNHCVNDTNNFSKQQASGQIFKNQNAQLFGIEILFLAGDVEAGKPNIILSENVCVNNVTRQIAFAGTSRHASNIFTLRDNIERGNNAYNSDNNRNRWSQQGRIFWGNGVAPASGEGAFIQGDVILNKNASAGGRLGFICVQGGDPAVWEVLGQTGVRTSISTSPNFIGQIAVVSGVAYIATGTSSSSDWKAMTT